MQHSLSTPSHNPNRPTYRNVNQTPIFQRRRSNSTGNCIIEKKRGFKPSDRFDPVKREFLVKLGKKFWCRPVRISIKSTLKNSSHAPSLLVNRWNEMRTIFRCESIDDDMKIQTIIIEQQTFQNSFQFFLNAIIHSICVNYVIEYVV